MYNYAARYVRAVDGDTAGLDLDLGFYQWRLGRTYRLARIDAPELRNEGGSAARDALAVLLSGARTILASTARADSFDRWIVELYADGQSVSDALVAGGHATYRTY